MMIVEHSNWGLLLLNYIYCNIQGVKTLGCTNLFGSSNQNLQCISGNISTVWGGNCHLKFFMKVGCNVLVLPFNGHGTNSKF